MAEPKTRPTEKSVSRFLEAIDDPDRRADALAVAALMKQATRTEPRMWGPNIVGFGSQTLTYTSGRQLDWPVAAFSPRKPSLVLYFPTGFFDRHQPLMKKLGPHKTGKGCLYIRLLDDVDRTTLRRLITESVRTNREASTPRAVSRRKAAKRPAAKKSGARKATARG